MTSITQSEPAPFDIAVEGTRQVQPVRRRVLLPYALAVGAYAILFTYWQVEPVPWNVHLLAIILAATCFLPLARWYATGSQGLPMFELICLSYALQFSMPVYTQPNWIISYSRQIPLPWVTISEVLLYVELGVVLMILGYALVRRTGAAQRIPTLDLPMIPERRTVYLWGALAGGVARLREWIEMYHTGPDTH